VFRHPFYQQIVPRIDDLIRQVAGRPSDRPPGLLVALSGGPDSVALLLAACAWADQQGGVVAAGHLNHQLRGHQAQADEDFCRQLCDRCGITLHLQRADPRWEARRRRRGLEEAARSLRIRFLERLLQAHPQLDCAATGHHRDDQTETIVMRLFRGTGLDGLRGILPICGRIIHPLLGVSRLEIVAFLQDEGQVYRIDATNESGQNTRSRIRRELLPLARSICGGAANGGPARLADLVTEDLALLDQLALAALPKIVVTDQQGISPPRAMPPTGRLPARIKVNRSGLLQLERALARRVLRLLYASLTGTPQDLSLAHVDQLLRWARRCRSGSSLSWCASTRVVREFDCLCFLSAEGHSPHRGSEQRYCLSVVSQTAGQPAAGGSLQVAAGPAGHPGTAGAHPAAALPGQQPVQPRWQLDCPAEALCGPLRLRPWRHGDRIAQLGLRGRKKISDLLAEKRVGLTQRPAVLVVEDDAGILWVVGLARAERTRILPTTQQIVTIAVAGTHPARDDDTSRH
jgi:tRNA(Ile)-lysidine synthase